LSHVGGRRISFWASLDLFISPANLQEKEHIAQTFSSCDTLLHPCTAHIELSHRMQALKEEAAEKKADAQRLQLQAVLDLETQYQHYERLISQAETALVSEAISKPRPNSGEPSGSQKLVSDEEARTDKLMQAIQKAWEEGAAILDLSEGFQGSLTWVPESLGHLTKLTDLNVSGQQLEVREHSDCAALSSRAHDRPSSWLPTFSAQAGLGVLEVARACRAWPPGQTKAQRPSTKARFIEERSA
jgi:hypothetical protein